MVVQYPEISFVNVERCGGMSQIILPVDCRIAPNAAQ